MVVRETVVRPGGEVGAECASFRSQRTVPRSGQNAFLAYTKGAGNRVRVDFCRRPPPASLPAAPALFPAAPAQLTAAMCGW
jgi:hypothetical protein